MNIYIRVSENQTTISGIERWNSYDKRMILKKCWKSLMMNVTQEDFISIYHHNVTDKTLKWLSENCGTLHTFIKVDSLEESLTVPLDDIKAYLKTEEDDKKLIALLEDDYLWEPGSLKLIKQASMHWRGFMASNDTPKNYLEPKKAHVFVGHDRYWRTSSFISWNLIGSTYIFNKFINHIKNAGILQDMGKLNEILAETECINPLPGVATHCKEGDMSPLVDWNFIWEGITI